MKRFDRRIASAALSVLDQVEIDPAVTLDCSFTGGASRIKRFEREPEGDDSDEVVGDVLPHVGAL
jgi:hypothetical protein